MKKKYLNKEGQLDAKKIAKHAELIHEQLRTLYDDSYVTSNRAVVNMLMMVEMKLIDLYQDLNGVTD